MTQTVGIIGVGAVGSTIAYTLVTTGTCKNFVFYDINTSKAEGVAFDLVDTHHHVAVQVCDLDNDAWSNVDVIVVAAGVKRLMDKSRLDLLSDNVRILETVFSTLKTRLSFFSKIILVSNPVDIVTSLAQKMLKDVLPVTQIFGTGTLLDTYRLQSALARRFNVKPSCVCVSVFGEHGDAQFVAWSKSHLGGASLSTILSKEDRELIEQDVRCRAKNIIDRRGFTTYGVSTVVNDLIHAIFTNERIIVPISVHHNIPDHVSLSTLAVVGEDGVQNVLPLYLNEEENIKFKDSATKLATILRDVDIGDLMQ